MAHAHLSRPLNFGFLTDDQSASASVLTSPRFDFDEAAAPTAGFRAGGVQRNAAPNLFQTLIEATAEVR